MVHRTTAEQGVEYHMKTMARAEFRQDWRWKAPTSSVELVMMIWNLCESTTRDAIVMAGRMRQRVRDPYADLLISEESYQGAVENGCLP